MLQMCGPLKRFAHCALVPSYKPWLEALRRISHRKGSSWDKQDELKISNFGDGEMLWPCWHITNAALNSFSPIPENPIAYSKTNS